MTTLRELQKTGRAPGIYYGLSFEDYLADPAIGSSGIKDLIVSPEEYWFNSPLNPDREPFDSNAHKVGRAYHAMVLEPWKPFPFKIKEGVKSSKVEGMMGEEDYKMLLRMYKRLLDMPKHWNALHGGVAEVSIFYRDKETGLMCKIRPDNWTPEWVTDLKTCSDVSSKALRWDFPKWKYHVNGTKYSIGMLALKEMIREGYTVPDDFLAGCEAAQVDKFVQRFMERDRQIFCFVLQAKDTPSKRTPNTTRLWNMTPYATEIGHTCVRKGLAVAAEYQDLEGRWPSGYDDVEDIEESMVSSSINYF